MYGNSPEAAVVPPTISEAPEPRAGSSDILATAAAMEKAGNARVTASSRSGAIVGDGNEEYRETFN